MLTPVEKLKQKVIHMATGETVTDPVAIRDRWAERDDAVEKAAQELRHGGVETGLPCDSSRHYSSRAVAAQMLDGSWVGWTYYFGGGKHGQPSEMEWMEDAYDVVMTEVVKVVREFRRADAGGGVALLRIS